MARWGEVDMSDGQGAVSGVRLRLARHSRGFSQQQLAGMAGVSRQAVSAVESGLSDPSLRVALALARALGMTVEEMFGSSSPAPTVEARPVAPLGGAGARVTLAPMGDGLVALPLSGATVSRAGFLPAGGLADAGVASEPAALAYGLAFVPLSAERFDLVIPAGHPDTREVQGLLKVLSSRWLRDQLASLPGYDPARCGQHIATVPPSQRAGSASTKAG